MVVEAISGVERAKSILREPRWNVLNSVFGWLWFHISTRLKSWHNLADAELPLHTSFQSPMIIGVIVPGHSSCVRRNRLRSL